MKFSIIIVAYKAEDKLKACLESLYKYWPPESELIIIDNSPEQVDFGSCKVHNTKYVYTKENLGYSAGANLGASLAKGEYLVFVNPDTIVSQFWHSEMVKCFNITDRIGAVGPISNYVAGLQNAGNHMQQYDDYRTNAKMALRGMAGRVMATDMLIGFFLMTPKKVFDEIGGFDPDLFLGCDDLDYSLKLKDAGYQMVIATEVYVYHFGHESFKCNPESELLIKKTENLYIDKLMKKYNGIPPTAEELWGFEMINTQPVKKATLSVSIIARAEGNHLEELVKQLDFADEIVITDTTPYNETSEIDYAVYKLVLSRKKIKYYRQPWNDSFAEARNFNLSKCTCDWVLWLDCDDRLPVGTGKMIRAIIDKPGPLTAGKKCHFGFKIVDNGHGTLFTAEQARMFPNVGIKWENRVHENYMQSTFDLGLTYVIANGISIEHTGYSDPKLNKQKSKRNVRLLEMEPDGYNKFYQLGKEYHSQHDYKKAIEYYEKSLTGAVDNGTRDHIRYSIALAHYQDINFTGETIEGYLTDNTKPDSIFLLGEYYYFNGDIDKSRELYLKYLSFGDIVDTRGSNQTSFTECAKNRINSMEKI